MDKKPKEKNLLLIGAVCIIFIIIIVYLTVALIKSKSTPADVESETSKSNYTDNTEKVTEEIIETETKEITKKEDVVDPESIYGDFLKKMYEYLESGGEIDLDVSSIIYEIDHADLYNTGYCFKDLDNNGIPELIISMSSCADYGWIIDAYTYNSGEVVHLLETNTRSGYAYCKDNTVYFTSTGNSGEQLEQRMKFEDNKLHNLQRLYFEAETETWYYDENDTDNLDKTQMREISYEESENLNLFDTCPLEIKLFAQYGSEDNGSVDLIGEFSKVVGNEKILYFIEADYDGDGKNEAYGITGNVVYSDIDNFKLYFISSTGDCKNVFNIDSVYGYGSAYSSQDDFKKYNIMYEGNKELLFIGGYDGQEVWIFGVKNGDSYQPEVSGRYSDYFKEDDGTLVFCPHEGGEGYFETRYHFNEKTGEYEQTE